MNIGCDIESVDTFRDHLKKKRMDFFKRLFSADEIAYCKKFKDSAPHFAARFCAKEGVVKAASKYAKLLITDIQIQHDKNGAPVVKVWKKRKDTEKFFSSYEILVSLSHTSDIAMACVLIQKK